jgi:hypothetical protein
MEIAMNVSRSYISTLTLKKTHDFLHKQFPSVLKTKCFNKHSLPFSEEVKNTQFAHLFEHILLTYLCSLKQEQGEKIVLCDGLTSWNWKENPYGSFSITIKTSKTNMLLMSTALEKTIVLCEQLFQFHEEPLSYDTYAAN